MTKELLFSITAKDCEFQTFRAGGKGGQHQNKTETGVRCIHRASGAVGEARDSRSQLDNKRTAFARMAQTVKFKKWHRIESAKMLGIHADVDKTVDEMMNDSNLKIEIQVDGKWMDVNDEHLEL
jgi:peptide chain release factor 1